jgi:hypothetical protein
MHLKSILLDQCLYPGTVPVNRRYTPGSFLCP